MDEMCQDLVMPGDVKNTGRLIRSVGAFHIFLARKGIGADRHKQSLNLGKIK